jgi:hypothetical protein
MSTDTTPALLDLEAIRAAVEASKPPGWARGELAWRRDAVALLAEVERLRRAVAGVRALHVPKVYKLEGGEDWLSSGCTGCGYAYPCPTIKAIDGAAQAAGKAEQ